MTKGTVPKPKTDRDNQLIADYLEKDTDGNFVYSTVDLVKKYDITPQRISQIREKHGVDART